jgi:hypothetical protein
MEKSRWIKPETAKRWIALDGAGEPHGRFCSTSPLSETLVLGVVRSLLPEVANLRLISWNLATPIQRIEASKYRPFTPLMCAKLGIHSLPEPPPPPKLPVQRVEGLPPYRREPSLVGRWAGKLQKHFAHTAAAGGSS